MSNEMPQVVNTPALSVVLVAPQRFAALRRTLRHLRAQTIVDQIQLIILGTTEAELGTHTAEDIAGFHSVKLVAIGVIENVDKANAKALPHVQAPAVAFIEDHGYPMPEWAAEVVAAFRKPFTVVGTAMINANPDSMMSWVNLLLAHGGWIAPAFTGERGTIGLHNSSFRVDALRAFGDQLVDKMGRDGGLLETLHKQGERFYLPANALLSHTNPSRLSATVNLRFNAGRLYGAQRAESEGWSLTKRLLYIGGGVLIPLVRFVRVRREMARLMDHHQLTPRILPLLAFILVVDAAGQMVGYAAGYGKSRYILAVFEMDRIQHLNGADRSLLLNS